MDKYRKKIIFRVSIKVLFDHNLVEFHLFSISPDPFLYFAKAENKQKTVYCYLGGVFFFTLQAFIIFYFCVSFGCV